MLCILRVLDKFDKSIKTDNVYQMNRFYIVRHGQTLNNRDKRLSGWVDTPLTAEGLEATQRAINKVRGIGFDAVYASDLGRAFITAYVISRDLGLPNEIRRMPGLREVNYGDASHMKTVEAYKKYPRLDRDTHYIPPNGQSLAQMQAIVLETVTGIDAAHTDANVLLVAHSGVMAALNASYQRIDFGGHNISEAYEHDAVKTFELAGGRITRFVDVA
jgi:probable phosphoglycerate mutase